MQPWPKGVARLIFDTLPSTNAWAATRLGAGGDAPFWVLAHQQTEGRGRRGRAWRHPAGNFAASYGLFPNGRLDAAALHSFVTALSLHDALAPLIPEAETRLRLKWPNDVLLDGAKLSGILLETAQISGRTGLIVGIGINLASAPDPSDLDTTAHPPTSLAQATGETISPEDMLDRLAPAVETRKSHFAAYGFSAIRQDWLERAAGLGQPLVARAMQHEYRGRFVDLAANGALVLDTGTGRLELSAADVYFGAAEKGT